jgi:hypothetical protein
VEIEYTLKRDPDSDFEGKIYLFRRYLFVDRTDGFYSVEVERIHADEENLLKSVESNSQEAVVSCLSLHWVNDLPGEHLRERKCVILYLA